MQGLPERVNLDTGRFLLLLMFSPPKKCLLVFLAAKVLREEFCGTLWCF